MRGCLRLAAASLRSRAEPRSKKRLDYPTDWFLTESLPIKNVATLNHLHRSAHDGGSERNFAGYKPIGGFRASLTGVSPRKDPPSWGWVEQLHQSLPTTLWVVPSST